MKNYKCIFKPKPESKSSLFLKEVEYDDNGNLICKLSNNDVVLVKEDNGNRIFTFSNNVVVSIKEKDINILT